MEKEERRRYVFAQLKSLPNAFQYVEVTQYIKDLETELKKQKEVIDKLNDLLSDEFLEVIDRDILLQILEDKEV